MAKSSLRPIRFLLDAYLTEHYKNRTGSVRKVFGKDLGIKTALTLEICSTSKITTDFKTKNFKENPLKATILRKKTGYS